MNKNLKRKLINYLKEDKMDNNEVEKEAIEYLFTEDDDDEENRGLYDYIEDIMEDNEEKYNGSVNNSYFEEINKFLKFYSVLHIKMYTEGASNLKSIAKKIFDYDKLGEDYKEQVRNLNVDDWLEGDNNFEKFYKDLCKHYSKLPDDAEIKKNSQTKKSKRDNFKGKNIYNISIEDLKEMDLIMQRQPSTIEADKAHRKIRTNNVDKMTDKNLRELHNDIDKKIKLSNKKYKNIQYYKLEKKLGYEFHKCVFKCMHKLDNDEEKKHYAILAVKYVYRIPVLTIKESLLIKLLKVFDEKSIYTIENWISDIKIIWEIIYSSLEEIFDFLKDEDYFYISETEMEEFGSIYNIDKNGNKEFSNQYKIKKDYDKHDTEIYFNVVQALNNKK